MTVYILSCGRSGSAWLSTALMATGFRVKHEGVGNREPSPLFIADTRMIWWPYPTLENGFDSFEDRVIILDRPWEEVEQSVKRLIGDRDVTAARDAWDKTKEAIKSGGIPCLTVEYKDLFEEKGRNLIASFLTQSLGLPEMYADKYCDVWEFMRHMRVTNKTAEDGVKESYGISP